MEEPSYLRRKKRTTVLLSVVRFLFRSVQRISPSLASRMLARVFLTARRHPTPLREKRWLRGSRKLTIRSRRHRVSAWTKGNGPVVLLVHGWEGRGSQMGAFADALAAVGFQVVTFDAPGHGESTGRTSSLVEMADAVEDVASEMGPVFAVVAHSAGTAASSIALDRGLAVEAALYIAPPLDLGDFLDTVARLLGLDSQIATLTQKRIERRFNVQWDDLKALHIAPRMSSPLVLIHDRHDRQVPWENSRTLAEAWPGARLISTSGLGHQRILNDPGVVTTVVEELRHLRRSPLTPLHTIPA